MFLERIVNLQNTGIKLSKMAILTRASFQFKDLRTDLLEKILNIKLSEDLDFMKEQKLKMHLPFLDY